MSNTTNKQGQSTVNGLGVNPDSSYNQFIIDMIEAVYTGNVPASRVEGGDTLADVIEELEWRLDSDYPETFVEYFHRAITALDDAAWEAACAPTLDNPRWFELTAVEEEAEANSTAELDAYLDSQLALQGELTKMTEPREVTMKRLYLQLEELEAEMEQLHREGAAEGEYHDNLENAINDLYNEIGE